MPCSSHTTLLELLEAGPQATMSQGWWWKLAVIEELLPGRDGHVHAVSIHIKRGTTNRLVAKLYPLENLVPTVPRDDRTMDLFQGRPQKATAM